jgi:hypothetical protein
MLTFALVGVALLPAIFFYLALTVGQKWKPLRIAFISFALFTCMMIAHELIISYPTLAGPAETLQMGLQGFLFLYLGIELLLFLVECKQALDKVTQGRDWRGGF